MRTIDPSKLGLAIVATTGLVSGLTACSSGMEGTYADSTHSMVLEIQSGSKAVFTALGTVSDCTYVKSGTKLTLNCPGDIGTVDLVVHDNGSLTGPPNSYLFPVLQKQK